MQIWNKKDILKKYKYIIKFNKNIFEIKKTKMEKIINDELKPSLSGESELWPNLIMNLAMNLKSHPRNLIMRLMMNLTMNNLLINFRIETVL